jgi:hypothetical protein
MGNTVKKAVFDRNPLKPINSTTSLGGRTPYIMLVDDMYEYLNKLVLYLPMGVP